MLFKNAIIYQGRATQDWSVEKLTKAAEAKPFKPCAAQEAESAGWVPALIGTKELVHNAGHHHRLLRLKIEQKILPAATINEHLAGAVAQLEQAESRRVGRKERQNLREEVALALLPQAFTKSFYVRVWLDQSRNRVIIDTTSRSRAGLVLNLLREGLGSLPVAPINTEDSPRIILTGWVKHQPPAAYELLDNFELMDFESDATVKCKNQDISSAEIDGHLDAGMFITRLQLRWSGSVTCTVTDQLDLRGIKYDDYVHEQVADNNPDADPLLEQQAQAFEMTALLSKLIESLVQECSGVAKPLQNVKLILGQE